MDVKNFCEQHWSSEAHSDEPRREDSGGRLLIFAPEGETCSFCPAPATHTGLYAEPAPVVRKSVPAPPDTEPAPRKPTMRPSR